MFKQSLIAFGTSYLELTLVWAAVVYFNLGSMSSTSPSLHFLQVSLTGSPGTFEAHSDMKASLFKTYMVLFSTIEVIHMPFFFFWVLQRGESKAAAFRVSPNAEGNYIWVTTAEWATVLSP